MARSPHPRRARSVEYRRHGSPPTHTVRSLTVVRESVGADEIAAALGYLGIASLPAASRLFVLADVAEEVSFPLAAAIVRSEDRIWRLGPIRAGVADAPRLVEELVRLATADDARQLVSPPPPDSPAGALLRRAPVPATVHNGWVVVDL